MLSFQVVGTFLDAPVNFLSGITDLEVAASAGGLHLFGATRPGGGIVSISVGATMTLRDLESLPAVAAVPAPARLDAAVIGGVSGLIVTGGSSARLGFHGIGESGMIGPAGSVIGSPAGAISALEQVSVGIEAYVYTARLGDSGLVASRLLANGRMEEVAQIPLGPDWQGVDVSDMASVTIGAETCLLVLSVRQNALLGFRVGAGGVLTPTGSLGSAGGLGIAAPAAIETVRVAGQDYALVAAAGSSSISVVAIGAGGALSLADHVVDTLDSRFQGILAMATVTLGDRVFLFAGGGDDGINLFEVLPGGRLLLVATELQSDGLALHNISAIAAVQRDGGMEAFVAGDGPGITRLRADPGPLAPTVIGKAGAEVLTGDGRGDLLDGAAGNDTISGADGGDILIDGAGADLLSGGSGADHFVLARDGSTDTIVDFQRGIDRIDLTAWGRIYSVAALDIETTATGATIRFGTETLVIRTMDASPLRSDAFLSSELFTLWHAGLDPVVAGRRITGTAGADRQTGGAGDDVLVGSGGADRMDGGAGIDTADYSAARGSQRIDLMAPHLNTNLALGDTHVSVEAVTGGTGSDNIRGTTGANILRGGGDVDWLYGRAGNDLLDGGAGDDVLLGGVGQDTLAGGANRDRAQYSESLAALTVDLQFPQNNTGEAAGDVFEFVEDLAGSSLDDRLFGDAGANRLFGRDGADMLSGRNGADYLNGGAGRDTLDGGIAGDTLRGGTQADSFVFNGGADLVEDFRRNEGDVLLIEDAIFGPGWDTGALIDSFASVRDGQVVFDFGFGNTLTLQGVSSLDGLEGSVTII